MDSLFPIILLVVVLSLISKAKKKAGNQNSSNNQEAARQRQQRINARIQKMNGKPDPEQEEMTGAQAVQTAFTEPFGYGEGNDPCHDELLGHSYPPAAPSGSMTVAFARQDTENSVSFMAPLQAEEGVDPCHEEYLTGPARNTEPDENEDTQWQNNDLLRGIIVSQILTRPVSMRKRT